MTAPPARAASTDPLDLPTAPDAPGPNPADGSHTADVLWSQVRPDAARRLLLAAVESFAARGYHATTTRDISARAGVSPGTLYVHFATKADLLARISIDGHRSTLDLVEASIAGVEGPRERLAALVAAFVRWHAEHHVMARVVQYELTALPPDAFAEVAGLRRRIEALARAEIGAGVGTGDFEVDDVATTARAILSLGIDVARWYGVGSRQRPDAQVLAGQYADLALRMLSPAAGSAGTGA